jgi:hypothetical protein
MFKFYMSSNPLSKNLQPPQYDIKEALNKSLLARRQCDQIHGFPLQLPFAAFQGCCGTGNSNPMATKVLIIRKLTRAEIFTDEEITQKVRGLAATLVP